MDLEKINNLVISSLQDEETVGVPEAVGTLQLFNRINMDVSQDDLARVSHIRKLIGSILVKCAYSAETLQTVVGLKLEQ